MNREKSAYTVQTVHKAFELLEMLAESSTGLNLTQLAAAIDLSRNKTYRMLATLCEQGLADRTPEGTYHVGVYSVALAQKLLRNASLVNYAQPVMQELARKHDEAVYMTVIKDDEVVFLDMVDCDQNVKAAPLV